MVAHGADGILGAVARVNTLLVAAGQSGVTVWITEALGLQALTQRVAKVLRQAGALGLVVAHRALGIDATSLKGAGVEALSVEAGLVIGALVVTLAPS